MSLLRAVSVTHDDFPSKSSVSKAFGINRDHHPKTEFNRATWGDFLEYALLNGAHAAVARRGLSMFAEDFDGAVGGLGAPLPVEVAHALQQLFAPPDDEHPIRWDSWEDLHSAMVDAALAETSDTLSIRVLGTTMNRAWKPITRPLLRRVRERHPEAPVAIDLLQLDPTWPGTSALHGGYERSIEEATAGIRSSVDRVVSDHQAVNVRLRRYSQFFGVMGVAIGAQTFVGLVGLERDAVAKGRPYYATRADSVGLAGDLHRRFDRAWIVADADPRTTTIVPWTGGEPNPA